MNESLLTKEELAVRLNLTAAQIDRLRKEGKIHPLDGFKRPFKYNLKSVKKDIERLSNAGQ